jgi:hypothetical protein
MQYRFYLVDVNDRIRAGESFSASDDREAREVAALVHDNCSDAFAGYELWRGTARIAHFRQEQPGTGEINLTDVVRRRQANILELEDRLQTTFSCMRESRKLLKATALLRTDSTVSG